MVVIFVDEIVMGFCGVFHIFLIGGGLRRCRGFSK